MGDRTEILEKYARLDTFQDGSCSCISSVPEEAYSYLLGLYLGDGHVAQLPRGVYRLRIFCTGSYVNLINECRSAMGSVLHNVPGTIKVKGVNLVVVYSYSKHWPHLFPQIGPGMKHRRKIVLEPWQQAIVDRHPRALLKGLIHSDGCRAINRVKGGRYEYVRYFFSNQSNDIHGIFTAACDRLGIKWRFNRIDTVSIARRDSVALMDSFIGPKS